MNRKNIFKTLAAAMLMPAMLLTTSCSSEDDLLNTENTAKKGYTLPVTVNVTRQGDDATTRATYTYNEETKKGTLAFSTGDKLFVYDSYNDHCTFAGTLDYVSGGTFSGTITTETEWTGPIDELLADAVAQLLPAGYESYGYLSITENNGYDDKFVVGSNAFSTSKVTAVEQFSLEQGLYNSGSGFELQPSNGILNFTITGLEANTPVAVEFTEGYFNETIAGNVTTDGDGTATFVIGVFGDTDLKDCTLTVGGKAITTVSSSKYVEAGKIYNITRSAATPATSKELSAVTDSEKGWRIGSDGKAYSVTGTLPSGVTAVAMIAYVGSATDNATYQHGLAIALSDEGSMDWSTAKTACEGKAAVSGAVWLLPSQNQWKAMFNANGGSEESSTGLNNALATAGGNSSKFQEYGRYWSSTELDAVYGTKPIYVYVGWGGATWDHDTEGIDTFARACLAF